MQSKNLSVLSDSEREAPSKLAYYVYEYLVKSGAKSSADTFKNEILKGIIPDAQIHISETPSFLYDWWCIFWDLYSAAPERRDKSEYSLEAKAFHELFMSGPGPGHLINGMPAPPPFTNAPAGHMPGGMPPQAMEAGMRYMPPGNARSGAPTPSNVMGVPHNFTPGQQQQMFINEQQMRMGMQHRIPQGAIGMRMMNFQPGPGGPNIPMRHFMDQSNTPPFQPNQMISNGGMCPSTTSVMSSPGPAGGQLGGMAPAGAEGMQQDSRFMMMNSNMSSHYINQQESVGNGGPSSVSCGMTVSTSEGNIMSSATTGNGQLHNLLNGGVEQMEVKQSPSSIHHNASGTPGSGPHSTPINMPTSAGGPHSATGIHGPGSVHSQTGVVQPNGGSNVTSQQLQQHSSTNETSVILHQGVHPNGGGDVQEISKIKQSLMEEMADYTGPGQRD